MDYNLLNEVIHISRLTSMYEPGTRHKESESVKVIHTHSTTPGQLKGIEKDWVYNGLDCCVTAEVLEALLPQLNDYTQSNL